ncbi:MAG: hypothetical protein GY702_17115 [Desulfobulbaceae bacterium]|nr:hypothetical protein [Desulfobulbaceae bacterium]
MDHPELLILIWIIIILILWYYIRTRKPGLIGLGKDPNRQKLDGAKFSQCPECNEGFLEPIFRWWQYAIPIGTPLGFFVIGKPLKYTCNNCQYQISTLGKSGFISRLPLSQKLSPAFFVGLFAYCILGIVFFIVFTKYIKP